jgi:3-dehydroquinate synthetase
MNYIRTTELKHFKNAEVYKLMLKDKKNSNGKIKFVLVFEPGKLLIDVESEKDEVMNALNYFKEKINKKLSII